MSTIAAHRDHPSQAMDPRMRGNANEDLLRFVLVIAFLLALVAILLVVAFMIHQP